MREVNPNMVMIVIGEHEGGCTANYNFFNNINIINDKNIIKINKLYSCWNGIHDNIMLVK
jgi:hypothetical protein